MNSPASKSSSPAGIGFTRRRHIATELAISLVLLVLIVEGVLLAVVYQRQAVELFEGLQEKADAYAVNLSQTLAVPIWDMDDQQVERIGEGFARNDLVAALHIRDIEGTVFYRFTREHDEPPVMREIAVTHSGKTIGHARIALSVSAYRKDLVWLRNMLLVVLAVSLVVIVIATGVLLRVLMRRPLAILQKGMDRVARGDDDYRFEEIHHAELADIAQRFNTMAGRVREREGSLKTEVSERKRAEQKIRERDRETRAILNAIPDTLFQFDRDGLLLDLRGDPGGLVTNAKRCIGRRLEEVMPESVAPLFRSQLEEAFIKSDMKVFEFDLPDNETTCYYESRLVAVSEDLALGMVRDITDRIAAMKSSQRLLEQLQRAQKMEAIGMLAGGVAHDLNNVLSGVVSYPELILLDLPDESPLRKPMRTIQKSGERAANIVQDLLTLARRGVSVAEVVNLNEVIGEYLSSPECEKLCTYHPGIQLIQKLDEGLLDVVGSPIHLIKTVMNLVSNAAEATEQDGVVHIETRNHYIDASPADRDDIQPGNYVVVTVRDNGVGISEEDINRIFEPFYTKKVMGRSGTGLGMAVVWGTVKDHKGHIEIQSAPQEGTSVTIFLPATEEKRMPKGKLESNESLRGNGERILVVDDVDQQRDIATTMLSRMGYVAESVDGGDAAINYVRRQPVDLLVLDMIMDPGIDGLETYRRILAIHPGQRAVITSGFSESDRVTEARRIGAGQYVKKPYRLETLARAVKEELTR